jgi:hypothetical protein
MVVTTSALVGCTFDSTVAPTARLVHVPVVICDADATATACTTDGNEMSWIVSFGSLEFMDGTLGAAAAQSGPIGSGSGCQHEGRLEIYPIHAG